MILPRFHFLLLLLVLFSQSINSQKVKKADKTILVNLETHIHYLADDKLEGRRTGTQGERMAMNYISEQFKQIGLQPKGTDNYYQPFDVNEGKQINAGTSFIINGDELKQGKDYFPFVYSPNISIEAMPAISVQESDMPWFIDLNEISG